LTRRTGTTRPLAVALLGWTLLMHAGPVTAQDAGPAPLADEVALSARQLEQLRERIGTVRGELAELETQRADARASLSAINRETELVEQLLAGLDRREVLLGRQRDSLQVRLQEQVQSYDARREALAQRLRRLYMRGPQHDLEQIITSASFSTLVARLKFGAMLARLDGSLVERTRAQARQIEQEQQALQSALAGIWEAREEARGEQDRLELLKAERRGLVRELEQRQDRAAGELTRLQRQEQQLVDLLARLEERRLQRQQQAEQQGLPGPAGPPTGGMAFTERQGDLPWPAPGRVVREFGRSVHPRFGTVTEHNGVTIAATPGAPVYAVAPGTVEFADHLPGFGRCVILDHGGGHYTLYANLDGIFVARGDAVPGGRVLAEMGSGDSAGGPELYFEIREGREARDPRHWLRPSR
jgi:septal ring factor EnvC (AmiA/AmiB activator)